MSAPRITDAGLKTFAAAIAARGGEAWVMRRGEWTVMQDSGGVAIWRAGLGWVFDTRYGAEGYVHAAHHWLNDFLNAFDFEATT